MSDINRFRALGKKEKCIVAIALLIDGPDALDYLSVDKDHGIAFERIAKDFLEMPTELRVSFLATTLRETLKELREQRVTKLK